MYEKNKINGFTGKRTTVAVEKRLKFLKIEKEHCSVSEIRKREF